MPAPMPGLRVVVARLAVLAVVLAGCGGAAQTSAGDVAPTPTADAAPASAASTGAAAVPSTGAEVVTVDGLDGATLFGVAAGEDRWLAVGSHDSVAAGWVWSGAGAWERAQVGDAGRARQLRAVAAGSNGMVAFGGDDATASSVWTSVDGRDWTPQTDGNGISSRVNAVTWDGGRWLAVGDLLDDGDGGEAVAGALHASTDGQTWRTLSDAFAGSEVTLSGVASTGDLVVVTGFDVDGGKIWRHSEAGTEPAAGDFSVATIQGVAAQGEGFVALGRNIVDLSPVLWTAPADAARWERVTLDGTVFTPTDEIHGLATVDGRLVAVGASPSGGVIWTSTDGRTWTRSSP